MKNFTYCTPTNLIFGKESIEQLPEIIKPFGKRVLLTYGGGSIKKIGLYDEVKRLLADFEIYELSGIEPNPEYSTSVVDGVKLCKNHQIDVVLAIGGGSVLDCSKTICVGALYDGETWDLISHKAKAQKALPLITVLTAAATGSEYNNACVISRRDTNDKIDYSDSFMYPAASILDPRYTFSVSKKQTAAGTADAITHVMEQYFCAKTSLVTDGMCEAVIRSLIKNGHTALTKPDDYDARAELMVDCSLACSNILSLGNSSSGWPLHCLENALSGYYNITHGEGLAILTPGWMKHILSENTIERFICFGTHIFNIDASLPKNKIATKTIEKTYEMFASFGVPMHLRDVGIDESRLSEMAHHTITHENLNRSWVPLNEQDVLEIYKSVL